MTSLKMVLIRVLLSHPPLLRINPTLGREALSRISDPGHVLRESLTHLKETLSSGMAQLHFDVSIVVSFPYRIME